MRLKKRPTVDLL